jgi:hypothetical protein
MDKYCVILFREILSVNILLDLVTEYDSVVILKRVSLKEKNIVISFISHPLSCLFHIMEPTQIKIARNQF